ncbi:hypothetical protein HPB49_000880 [Dermacentor silvarum]|uniref:Uncharacterized protein n=1 Tax=Dermacentor silvarum TaxID=543639 RepID=A0ACB8CU65_DERSI|nr:hypothetical protein HPB49_000880 [Dermacentor silvarum]
MELARAGRPMSTVRGDSAWLAKRQGELRSGGGGTPLAQPRRSQDAMSQDAAESAEHPAEVPATGGEGAVEERHSTGKYSVGAESSQAEDRGAKDSVDGGASPQKTSRSEREGEAAPDRNQDENASLVAKVPAGVGVEPDVAFADTVTDTRCGLLWFRPAALQRFCKPRYMLANMCAITFTHSFLANGVINVVLPTLERRFQLRSFESAMIISTYNVANCVAIAPIAFMGTSGNKPVFIGVGALTVGLGALLFTSVHFIAPAYQWGSELQDLCPAGPLPKDLCLSGDVRNYRFLLMLAHAMHGIGSTPFYTLGVSYLDENVPTRMVSTYLGKGSTPLKQKTVEAFGELVIGGKTTSPSWKMRTQRKSCTWRFFFFFLSSFSCLPCLA